MGSFAGKPWSSKAVADEMILPGACLKIDISSQIEAF